MNDKANQSLVKNETATVCEMAVQVFEVMYTAHSQAPNSLQLDMHTNSKNVPKSGDFLRITIETKPVLVCLGA